MDKLSEKQLKTSLKFQLTAFVISSVLAIIGYMTGHVHEVVIITILAFAGSFISVLSEKKKITNSYLDMFVVFLYVFAIGLNTSKYVNRELWLLMFSATCTIFYLLAFSILFSYLVKKILTHFE